MPIPPAIALTKAAHGELAAFVARDKQQVRNVLDTTQRPIIDTGCFQVILKSPLRHGGEAAAQKLEIDVRNKAVVAGGDDLLVFAATDRWQYWPTGAVVTVLRMDGGFGVITPETVAVPSGISIDDIAPYSILATDPLRPGANGGQLTVTLPSDKPWQDNYVFVGEQRKTYVTIDGEGGRYNVVVVQNDFPAWVRYETDGGNGPDPAQGWGFFVSPKAGKSAVFSGNGNPIVGLSGSSSRRFMQKVTFTLNDATVDEPPTVRPVDILDSLRSLSHSFYYGFPVIGFDALNQLVCVASPHWWHSEVRQLHGTREDFNVFDPDPEIFTPPPEDDE